MSECRITPKELARRIKRGERWKISDKNIVLHRALEDAVKFLTQDHSSVEAWLYHGDFSKTISSTLIDGIADLESKLTAERELSEALREALVRVEELLLEEQVLLRAFVVKALAKYNEHRGSDE